jgi:hypothetical protein
VVEGGLTGAASRERVEKATFEEKRDTVHTALEVEDSKLARAGIPGDP